MHLCIQIKFKYIKYMNLSFHLDLCLVVSNQLAWLLNWFERCTGMAELEFFSGFLFATV